MDFAISPGRNSSCVLPDFWDDTGNPAIVTATTPGCSNSEFDSYGDMEAFGVHPDCTFATLYLPETRLIRHHV